MARLGRGFPNNPIMRAPILVKAGPRWDSTGAGAVQTPTWTHTMGPLVNAVVVLGYWVTNSGSGNALVSVNGTSVPTVTGGTIGSYGSGTLYSGGAGTTGTYFPTLCSIPTGAQTFTLSLPGGTSWDYAFNSFAYTNVKSIGTGTSATGASLNAALSMTLTPNQIAVGAFGGATNATTGTGFSNFAPVQRWNQAPVSGKAYPIAAGESTTGQFSATAPNASPSWGCVAVPLAA
ncbi:hypothetical protein MMAN_00300 [Mycobacterium mantenii]|uniref:Minor tail protein n=2 Tax=Mycobacterium mantenii TaxID=560555 RepID=A0ABM7JKB8_MYCNT|nr:hypothetical protein MMAN_00300 [Mycobacterium mantenii]